MTVKLLTEKLYSLIGDCTGLSESSTTSQNITLLEITCPAQSVYIFLTKKQDNLGLELQCILKVKEYLS